MIRLLFIILTFSLLSKSMLAQSIQQDMSRDKVSSFVRVKKENNEIRLLVTNSKAFKEWLKLYLPNMQITENSANVFSGSALTETHIKKLTESPFVNFIDKGKRKAVEETIFGDFDFTLNTIRSAHSLYPNLTGEGLAASIKEKPFDPNDLDLQGRVIITNQFDEFPSLHATLMATTIGGAGNTISYAKGSAWAAQLTTSDYDQLLPDNGQVLTSLGVSVQNHSYGINDVENYYGIESAEYDKSCIDYPKILHVFSSGNRGDGTTPIGAYANLTGVANLTGQFKVSKNTIAVGSSDRHGNIPSLSSRGPAHDGRVKPELIALGDAGSSDAAAIVSGISLLIQNIYNNKFAKLPDAALVKAALINSAVDVGRPHVDFESGFGNANALGAIRIIDNDQFYSGTIEEGNESVFAIQVPENTHQVKVTLVWNDPQATPPTIISNKVLINDLDVVLRNIQTAEEWTPWVLNSSASLSALQQNATRGVDHLNNVEQITVSIPQAGNYEIIIKGFDIPLGPQNFFITYNYLSGFEWTYPLQSDGLKANTSEIIRWNWNKPDAIGSLEYKFASEDTWNLITDNVNLQQSWYEWVTPDTSALIQFRLTAGNEMFESVSFPISKPDRIGVGLVCEDEVMLQWNKIDNALSYTVYVLGDKYLEPQVVTADTFAIFQKAQLQTNYVSVSPSFATGRSGLRETTIDFNLQGVGCYFKSFLPESFLVTSAAVFNAQLGTIYNLQSATLERFRNNTFESVTSIVPPNLQTNFTIADPTPYPGTQQYRIKLTTNSETKIYSSTVEILYVRENDVYVYPNPISEGEFLQIIINDEEVAALEIFDVQGRPVRKSEDFGPIKEINTVALPRGIYIVRVVRNDGKVWNRRISVL